ncbi:MAG: ParB/RepB/Spo0J family partition protein [Gammaproteobacteria bacterium]|nr:ParB/RepB/Spo0J family partition protein [Gammaproteobacteria bacterium]MCW9058794.1 ParB/RepB/Spo0J family partition protein [Gammaproteobacteria bacterium]
MAAKKRGLGKGLNALLGSNVTRAAAAPVPAVASPQDAAAEGELRSLPVERIQRGVYQPRMDMHTESLQDLADSIKAQGVVQPIVVRLVGKGQYEIIAGERRWRAAQLAGLTEIPAVVREVDDRAAIAMALIENIQRENLNPLEEANALERLIREFELTHQQAAEAVGRSRAAVSNLLRLLELHDSVKEMVQKGQLEMGHARALLALPLKAQPDAAHQVAHRDLTVRATERLVKQLLSHPVGAAPAPTPAQSPDLLRLEQDLGDRLGARVQVKHGKGGKGQLVIQYNSLDELDGILGRIR